MNGQQAPTSWPTVSNNDGVYALPRIPAGAYEIRVEAKGFRAEAGISLAFRLAGKLMSHEM